ncbi:AAA family ATPase [Streptomyces sp. NPDC002574]|uniref:caspase, EACC1-associated type n=1 Tax=Streptomyces sp. NPDC002574 TaxID=3364652 RepID=UPI0036755A3E
MGGTLTDLGQAFTDRCGLPEENLHILRDPASPIESGLAVAEAAERAQDVLWVHFVGHGLVSPAGELYLATAATDSRPGRLAPTALAYSAVRDCVLQTQARSIVVVLDCCFSGRAVGALGVGTAEEDIELARVHGGFVLAAAARDELALAVPGAAHTAFTGELIRLLSEGDPDGPPSLTLRQAARYLDRVMPSRGYPRPRHRTSEWIDDLVLAPNPAYRSPAAGTSLDTAGTVGGPALDEPAPLCPYPGLAAFSPGQAQWFFGREQLTGELVTRLAARVEEGVPLAVVGASGSGKSSLLGAGLLAALSKGDLPRSGSRTWPRLRMTPTEHPLSELAARLAVMGAGDPAALHKELASDPSRITGIVRSLLERRAGGEAAKGARLVILVDQFEEAFTLCERSLERRLFVATLAAAATGAGSAEPAALVVFGVRADFFGQCAAFPELQLAMNTPVVVGPLTAGGLRDAIQRPALAVGLSLQPGLLEVVTRDLGARGADGDATEPLPDPGALPLLAHALQATWQRREGRLLTVAAYQQAGGIEAAVTTTAEETYAQMSPRQQRAAQRLMLRLVRVGADGQDTRRRVGTDRLLRDAADPGDTAGALEALVTARLVTQDADTAEITHEALLLAWPRLRQWLDADRAGNLVRQDLEEAAASWDRAGRDSGELYRGSRLDEARAWARSPREQSTSATVSAFLEASSRLRQRANRLRRSVIVVLTTLTLIAAGTAMMALHQRSDAQSQRNTAIFNQLTAEADALRSTQLPLAAQLDLTAYRMRPTPASYMHLVTDAGGQLSTAVRNGTRGVQSVAYRPDGRVLAAGGSDGKVKLWGSSGSAVSKPLGPGFSTSGGTVYSLAFSPSGRLLAVGDLHSTVRLWNVADASRPSLVGRPLVGSYGAVFSVAFSPDGRTLAAAEGDGTVRLWDVRDPARPEPLRPLPGGHPGSAFSVRFSPGGRTLASAGLDGTIRLWDVADPSRARPLGSPLPGPKSPVYTVAFSPDGRILAGAGDDGDIRLWNLADPAHPTPLGSPLTGPVGAVWSVVFSPDGHTLASGGTDDTVRLWNLADPAHPTPLGSPLTGLNGVVWTVAFSPDGRTLIGASGDDTIRVWPDPTGPGPLLGGHTAPIRAVSVSPNGRVLASSDSNGTVRLWNLSDLARPTPFGSPHTDPRQAVVSLAFSPDGHVLAGGDSGGLVALWNVSDPAHAERLGAAPNDRPTTAISVAFSPDGRLLASGNIDGTIRLWNVADPRRPVALGGLPTDHTSTAFSVAFSPDSRTLASAGGNGTVQLWNIADPSRPTPFATPPIHSAGSLYTVAFSPAGHLMASAGGDQTLRLWDVTNPAAVRPLGPPLTGHTGAVFSVAFSRDGRTVATAGGDGTVRLWNLSDPAHPAALGIPLTGHTSTVYSVAFGPDGHSLVSGGNDKTVRIWQLDLTRAIHRVCTATDAITPAQWHRYLPQLNFAPPCP